MQAEDLLEDTPIFAQLLGKEKIEHTVQPRMFQNSKRRRGKSEKRGTNFSNTGKDWVIKWKKKYKSKNFSWVLFRKINT